VKHFQAFVMVAMTLAGCGGPEGSDIDASLADVALDSISEVEEIASDIPDPCRDAASPADRGPFAVVQGSHELSLTVEGDTRAVPVTFFLPDVPDPAPLVIFTHGFSQEPAGYLGTGEYIASWGMVVVMPKIPGSAFSPVPHRVMAEYLRGVMDWAAGEGNAVEAPLAGKVDAQSVGLSGHSMDGKLSFLLAASDERVDAVFGVDPVDAGPPIDDYDPADWPSVTPELMPEIQIPIVALGQTVDGELSDQLSCAPYGNRFSDYYDAAVGPAVMIEMVGADHVSFLDTCDEFCSLFCRPGTDDPAVTLALTRKYLAAFFRHELMAESCARDWLAGDQMDDDVAAGLVLAESKNGF